MTLGQVLKVKNKFSDVFSDYKTFSSMVFLAEMRSLDIGWVRLGQVRLGQVMLV